MAVVGVDAPLGDVLAGYSGRRVLVTGHTGFVGSWLTFLLHLAGAEVAGAALAAEPGSHFERLNLGQLVESSIVDINDRDAITDVVRSTDAEFVFHLAAQALVFESYRTPVETFATNVVGTANVLEALKATRAVSCVVVTSDKCYAESDHPHGEDDPLGGDDPYSASKAGSELVAHAYRMSFFRSTPIALATARAGNIVGGGDIAANRLLPDLVRALRDGESLHLRHPEAVRPWQHVLDAVGGYLRLAVALESEPSMFARSWNFGPPPGSFATVEAIARAVLDSWKTIDPKIDTEVTVESSDLPERTFLALDSSRARSELAWSTVLDFESTAQWTASWYSDEMRHSTPDVRAVTKAQIEAYLTKEARVRA